MKTYIETERLILRDWKEDDISTFSRINGDPLVMEYYPSRLDEKATEHLVKNFQKHIDKQDYGFFAAEHKADGAFMGFAGLSQVPKHMPIYPSVEMAWRLDYEYWGSGYATEAAEAILDFGFHEQSLEEVVAYCVYDHERAHAILEKLGFSSDKKDDFSYAPKSNSKALQDYVLFKKSA